MNLDLIINSIEDYRNRRELSDEYLKSLNICTREEERTDGYIIGEYGYGIVRIEVNEVLPFLKELQKIKGKGFEMKHEVRGK